MPFRKLLSLVLLAGCAAACASSTPASMSRERMESFIAEMGSEYQGTQGAVRFTFDGVAMACISDVDHDRMRIVAPIASRASVDPRQLDLMLIANYHTSLDARYAASEGVIYSAFLHPLSTLSGGQLASALRQVASLAKTFGSTYSSGELTFGAPAGERL